MMARLLVLLLLLTGVTEAKRRSFRTVSAARNGIIDWPYSFLVIRNFEGNDWCLTANAGVASGTNLGLNPCDFRNAPSSQLFLLDNVGKIHSKVNPLQCFVVSSTPSQNSRIQFQPCDARNDGMRYNTFLHEKETGMIRVLESSEYCLTPTGNGPDKTDSIRTNKCSENKAGMVYDVVPYQCNPRNFENVECCTSSDCPRGSGGCRADYKCFCNTDLPGIECCGADDCNSGETCLDNTCFGTAPPNCNINLAGIECCKDRDCPRDFSCDTEDNVCRKEREPRCNLNNANIECCEDDDCPRDFSCDSNTCLSDPFFLMQDDDSNACVSAVNGVETDFATVGLERCKFRNTPARQLWRRDVQDKFHSSLDLEKCMLVGEYSSLKDELQIHIASCKVNMFLYSPQTGRVRLGADSDYCLGSGEEDETNAVGKQCKRVDNTQDFVVEFK